ncbi:MAG: PD40 domain-containing protein [Chloroflexi bacterium]|nr:PD40 domain-containing protein [Chloroflexota bacterium]
MAAPTLAADPRTRRVSVSSTEGQAGSDSYDPSVSADGRYVTFESFASDLVANDTNGALDVFVRDRQTGITKRVSVSSAGSEANSYSRDPSISADGRYVAFESGANNLVANDTNGKTDIFVRDHLTGLTKRVSVSSGEGQANSHSFQPSISADGRHVAFMSKARDLVANDTNGALDVFVRDRREGSTRRVSISSGEGQADSGSSYPSISADGRYVAFESTASDLVANDTNGALDVFVRDRREGTTRRMSISSGEGQADSGSSYPSISADGRYVAFQSSASDLIADDTNGSYDVFVRDRQQGETRRVSISSAGIEGDRSSFVPSISADGRYVAFHSAARNLVANDTNGKADVFVRDRQQGVTRRVSLTSSGSQADERSWLPSISADGRYVAFESDASNLVANDTNGRFDVFVRGPLP